MFDGRKYDCDHLFYRKVKGEKTGIKEIRCGKKASKKFWNGMNILHFCNECISKTASRPAFGCEVEEIV